MAPRLRVRPAGALGGGGLAAAGTAEAGPEPLPEEGAAEGQRFGEELAEAGVADGAVRPRRRRRCGAARAAEAAVAQ
eukprot:9535777-Lingulodinium_polyedra.AAC.1